MLIAKLFPHRQFLATRACEVCPRVNTRASTLRIRKKTLYLMNFVVGSIKTEFRGPFDKVTFNYTFQTVSIIYSRQA